MKKYSELQLVEEKGLRDSVVGRTEVLDRVGELLLLPNTDFATTEQVAIYYGVDIEAINSITNRHRDELESDGMKVFKKSEIERYVQNEQNVNIARHQGFISFSYEDVVIKIANRGARLFPKRAILRVGMLLRDSEVAKEVRTRLLDIIHDTEEQSPEIVQGIASEISEEKQLMLNRVEAEMNGDYDLVCEINAKLFALKNKRIKELESLNEKITAHSLTIAESRAVINRIVRTIAVKEYGGMFGKAWNEFYSKINYKLGINIRNRKRDKNDTLLDTLTDEEVFEVEKIARNWAVKTELDLDSLLKIA